MAAIQEMTHDDRVNDQQTKGKLVECEYSTWRLWLRRSIWYADGCGNKPNPGRHSLDTADHDEALLRLRPLDLLRAAEMGLAPPSRLHEKTEKVLTVPDGVKAYIAHVKRPRMAGGVAAQSAKRHKAVFDKFAAFLKAAGVGCWDHVKRHHLIGYAAWLDGEGYAYGTEFLELTTIKQAVKYLVEEELLPPECLIKMPLPKPDGTNTYCYREEQIEAMLALCAASPHLTWMRNLIAVLAFTGMRISELAGLRQSDVDLRNNVITLTDERYSRRTAKGQARTIKNSHSRSFPISPYLKLILAALVNEGGAGSVFTGEAGSRLRPDQVRICLKRDVLKPLESRFPSRKDETGFKDGRLHSFRHFFCSMCSNAGVSEAVVMDWLGHRSSAMVRHYYHLHDEEAQRQMAKVNVNWWPAAT